MLNGKTAVITGASRGIGAAIARKLAECGANIAVIYNGNNEKANAIVAEAETKGVKAMAYQCNVANFEECSAAIKKITEDFGKFEILINNAGINKDMLMLQMKEADFDDVLDINLKGAFNMIKHSYRQFMKQRYGKIVNITSVAGIMGNAGQTNYAASKAGMIGLTKSVAKELAGRNVCCNAIAPGFVETDMTEAFLNRPEITDTIPLKRMGRPEAIASLAAFLADDVSDYITGEVIRIDGGLAM